MPVEAEGEKLQAIVQVENDRPMLKYLGSPFFGGRGIDGEKKLFGSVQRRKFKVWENATRWNGGFILTYVTAVFSESGTGTRVLLRARASRVQRLLLAACIVSYCYFVGLVLFNKAQSAIGTVVLMAMGLLMLLAATVPFIVVHRFMARKVVGYLEEELGMVEVQDTPVPHRK